MHPSTLAKGVSSIPLKYASKVDPTTTPTSMTPSMRRWCTVTCCLIPATLTACKTITTECRWTHTKHLAAPPMENCLSSKSQTTILRWSTLIRSWTHPRVSCLRGPTRQSIGRTASASRTAGWWTMSCTLSRARGV